MSKVILITGASSGMGHATAIMLAERGHTVYGGARRIDRMDDLTSLGVTPVAMDVTKAEDNQRVVDQIMK